MEQQGRGLVRRGLSLGACALAVGLVLAGACRSTTDHAVAQTTPTPAEEVAIEEVPAPAAEEPVGLVVAVDEVAPRWSPNGRASVRSLAQGEHAYFGVLRMEPGAEVPEHRDESEEYVYVLRGHGVLTMEGVEYAIGPGTLVYMPALAKVSFRNGPEEMEVVQVFADPTSAAKYQQWLEVRPGE